MAENMSAIGILAEAAMSFDIQTVPKNVLSSAKRCLIDVCGVTIAGSKSDSARLLRKTAAETYGLGNCNIVGTSQRINPSGAAFVNATAAHALDFDDNCYAGIVHGSAVVFPAVLAVAQELGLDGSQLLLGFLTGLEVEFALAKALTNSIYDKGWWTTSVLGAIGSTAGVAKVVGLNLEMTKNALSLAAVGTGATRALRGTSAKHFYSGRAAELGVFASNAAKQGITGPINVFEDRLGLPQLLNDGIFHSNKLETLGTEYGLIDPGVDIKKYPVCYASHAAVDAVKEIVDVEGIHASDVAFVNCTVPPIVASNLTYHMPKNASEAQFSLHFAIASVLLYGGISLQHLKDNVFLTEEVKSLISKVKMTVGDVPKHVRSSHKICPEWGYVEIISKSGARNLAFVGSALGSASRPLSERALRSKFIECLQYGKFEGSSTRLYDKLRDVEFVNNTQELFC